MCGRFGVKLTFERLSELLRIETLEDAEWGPDYNIAPTDPAPVVVQADGPKLVLHRWGLVPFWAADPKIGARMINARADTVADKPAFRDALERRRVLVPASGWYEWTHAASTGKKKDKPKPTPHWLHHADDTPLVFAGLGASWKDKSTGERRETFCIITTEANADTRAIHDRMPVILEPDQQALWLAPDTPRDVVTAMLAPYRGPIAHHIVSTEVNDVRADGAQLIQPAQQNTLL